MLERQVDIANRHQIGLLQHVATIATLTLTVSGFLASQFVGNIDFTKSHRVLYILVLLFESLALLLSMFDYWQTIRFHQLWSNAYKDIDIEADEKFENRELQLLSQLGEIELKIIGKQPKSTNILITKLMVSFCLVGILLLITLFAAYFFDVPGNWG